MRPFSAAMVAIASLALGILATYLLFEQLPGVGYTIVVGAYMAALFLLSRRLGTRPLAANLWLLVPAAFFAVMVTLRTNATVTWINVVAGIASLALLVATWDRYPVWRLTFFGWLAATAVAGFNAAFRPVLVLSDAAARLAPPRIRPYTRPLAGGLLLAAPFLCLFTLLFASADAVFASAVTNVWRDIDLATMTRQALFATGMAWAAGGSLDHALGRHHRPFTGSMDRRNWYVEEGGSGVGGRGPLGIGETAVALILLLALFGAFVVFQLRYLFLPQDRLGYTFDTLTYSEYAREGFFQLLVVATLAILLIVSLDLFTRRTRQAHHWFFSVLSVALVASTFVIVVSSFRRLQLYGLEHSFTHLRLFSHTFTVWLGVLLVLLAIAIIVRRPRAFALGLFVSLALYAAGLNLLNPDAFIASANIDHATRFSRDIDRRNFVPLGEDAVPVLIARLDELDPINRRAIEQLLYRELTNATSPQRPTGWQSLNLSRNRAIELLEPRRALLAESCHGPKQEAPAWHSIAQQQRLIHELHPLC